MTSSVLVLLGAHVAVCSSGLMVLLLVFTFALMLSTLLFLVGLRI